MKHSYIFNQYIPSTRPGHRTADRNNHTGTYLAKRHLLISTSARRVMQSGVSQGNTHLQFSGPALPSVQQKAFGRQLRAAICKERWYLASLLRTQLLESCNDLRMQAFIL